MRFLTQVFLCCLIAGGTAVAQRGARGGGFGGGARGGGGFAGGGYIGGSGFRGGYGRGYYGRGYYGRGFYGAGLYGFPFLWSDWFDSYDLSPYGYYPYDFGYSSYWPSPVGLAYNYGYPYATYQTSPNVTVYYPAQSVTVAPQSAHPVLREYDQNGLEIQPASPLYLIAFNDHIIRAASSYRVEGQTLHYVTPEREDKEAPLNTVDRALTLQLNRERRVPFQLPPQ